MNIKIGYEISFRLDGRNFGMGKVCSMPNAACQAYEVELTTVCKEFPIGRKILVFPDEIM